MAKKPSKSSDPRTARLDAVRKEQAAKQRKQALIIWGVAAALVVAIAGVVAFAIIRDVSNQPSLAAVKTYEVEAGHTQAAVTYDQTPPVGGEHHPVWLNCGVYTEPVPDKHAVHSLEHGAVWVTYPPDLPEGDVEKLADALPDTYTLLSPYPDLDSPVVSAWGIQLTLDGADDPRLEAFVEKYRQGPQTPEPGAACTGGTSEAMPVAPDAPTPSESATSSPSS